MFTVQCTEIMVIEIQLKTKEMHKKVKQATVTMLGASKIKMRTACFTKERLRKDGERVCDRIV